MNKLVINHLDRVFVTSDAATIVKELEVVHPAAKMIVMASQQQENEFGDATNLVITFAGELLQQAGNLIIQGLHQSEVISGFQKAWDKCAELIEEMAIKTVENVRDLEAVIAALKPVVAAKKYGFEEVLTPLIAQACVQVLPRNPKNFNVDNVRVAKILGGGFMDTRVLRGVVLTRNVEGTITKVHNAKIAVFAGGIDASQTETKGTVLIHNADELKAYNRGEEEAMEKMIKEVADAGINVVVSGGAIGEMALHFIERYGMMVVKIQSKFELRRLCKAVGAIPMTRIGKPTAEEIGHCTKVAVEEVGSTVVTIFEQTEGEDSMIATLVVRAATQNMLDDVERAIDDATSAFKALCRDGRLLPGGGATEIELARRLALFGDSVPGLEQYAITKFGEALEVVPRTLAENAGLRATDIISSLYATHQNGNERHGIDIEGGCVGDMERLDVLDCLSVKANALRLASEATITVLRVDQIIMSKPAGGPKPPPQGARDEDQLDAHVRRRERRGGRGEGVRGCLW
eukprot:TRINITY_DN38411_c0_g1_i1.p1 TRINITY_DN38411_c0_g1~~TRINITY_DN38411_c0_g1_i1.p1  ORF type:complete len:573 (-),score=149.29 TRINITY_DN38411_c0_g1_i1:37-1590(-)